MDYFVIALTMLLKFYAGTCQLRQIGVQSVFSVSVGTMSDFGYPVVHGSVHEGGLDLVASLCRIYM